MTFDDELDRDLRSLRLSGWGRVAASDVLVPFLVLDADGVPVEPIRRFLREFVARGNAAGSVRSYAFDLLRWWRFLQVIGVEWDQVTSAEVRDFVLWLQQAGKSRRAPRTRSLATVGQVNAVTRKQYLGDRFSARTIRHSNAVLRCFYEFCIEAGGGPLVNPVVIDRGRGRRANAHHNPMEPFRAEGRLRYNPKAPKAAPRAMPDERWVELFAAMRTRPGPRGAGVGDQHRRPGGGAAGAAGRRRGLGRSTRPGLSQGQRRAAVATGQRRGVRVVAAVARRAGRARRG